jgi:hypothetical protein
MSCQRRGPGGKGAHWANGLDVCALMVTRHTRGVQREGGPSHGSRGGRWVCRCGRHGGLCGGPDRGAKGPGWWMGPHWRWWSAGSHMPRGAAAASAPTQADTGRMAQGLRWGVMPRPAGRHAAGMVACRYSSAAASSAQCAARTSSERFASVATLLGAAAAFVILRVASRRTPRASGASPRMALVGGPPPTLQEEVWRNITLSIHNRIIKGNVRLTHLPDARPAGCMLVPLAPGASPLRPSHA